MPELPEVETMRRGVQGIVGSRILAVEFPRSHCKPIAMCPARSALRRKLLGQRIQAIDRIGKRLLVRLTPEQTLVIEPRMTGLVLVADPPDDEHLRVRWQLDDVTTPSFAFWDRRGLGTLRLVPSADVLHLLGPDRIGPDALGIAESELRTRLETSRREIKVALLDQRVLAGVGNLYAAEILHVATIDPRVPCCEMTPGQWRRLTQAIQSVLSEAVQYEGSTLADGTYRNALNRAGSYQNHHRVYDRAGQLCTSCGQQAICRIVQAQRSTFFCPGCQRRA